MKFSKEMVLEMLGGEYPSVVGYKGFCWDAIDHWVIENGFFIPMDGFSFPVPGPSLKLVPIALDWYWTCK